MKESLLKSRCVGAIDSTCRQLALQDFRRLGHGFKCLMPGGGQGQSTRMGRCNHHRVACQEKTRHLVSGSADIERGASQTAGVQCLQQG